MIKLARMVARLYPGGWRKRYGAELDGLLEDVRPSWRDVLDLLKGGLQMRVDYSTPAQILAAFAAFGAAAGGLATLAIPDRFESAGQIGVAAPNASPVPAATLEQLARAALSEGILKRAIDEYGLYREEGQWRPTAPNADRMRRDIRVKLDSAAVFEVSFIHADRGMAQRVTRRLMDGFLEASRPSGWGLMVLRMPTLPDAPAKPARLRIVAWGAAAGLLAGMAALVVQRWLRHAE
jgi:hypothetical protein